MTLGTVAQLRNVRYELFVCSVIIFETDSLIAGRGNYYKNRYGGGRGRGRGGGSQPYPTQSSQSFQLTNNGGEDWQRLQNDLRRIDGKQYGAYKDLIGQYRHIQPAFTLSIDHVQGDAYAAPSRVSRKQ